MFPDTLYIASPNEGKLYTVENNKVVGSIYTVKQVCSLLVAQNMADVYTVNRDSNSITRINNDEVIGDIPVGNTPFAICEDPNGVIYVTNYSDNTVTLIENNQPYAYPINVDAGPKGIVSDSNGTIYVACYLSNTVVKIVNRTVVDRIQVPFNPEGITCDIQNNIWVTCSGSNCVVKITKGRKALTSPTGKRPVAVVVDTKMNVFVANYEDDTVTMLASENSYVEPTTIAVGDGPSAIAIDSKNMVYVLSTLSTEEVNVINPKSAMVVDRFHVCDSQSAFGDFTGCAAYNVFNPANSAVDKGVIANMTNILTSIKPRFEVTSCEDDGTTTILKIDSSFIDLNRFVKLTMNGVDMAADGTFTFPTSTYKTITNLELMGYYDTGETSLPFYFKPIVADKVFKASVGYVDENFENYVFISDVVVDFNSHDIVSKMFTTGPEGSHIVVLIPTRVSSKYKHNTVVNGRMSIGSGWTADNGNPNAIRIAAALPAGMANGKSIIFDPNKIDDDGARPFLFFFFVS